MKRYALPGKQPVIASTNMPNTRIDVNFRQLDRSVSVYCFGASLPRSAIKVLARGSGQGKVRPAADSADLCSKTAHIGVSTWHIAEFLPCAKEFAQARVFHGLSEIF